MPSTSWSEINLFRKCPAAHDYRYRQRLQRKRPIVPMLRGKIMHEMLEHYTLARKIPSYDQDPWDALEKYEKQYRDFFREEQEEYGNIPEQCAQLFEGYLKKYRHDNLDYEGVEEFVATDLATDLRIVGYVDAVVLDENNRRWIMDRKFHKNIPSAEDRFHELQLIVYLWIWNRWQSERPADGILWDYVRTSAPTEPAVLKDGSLSKRKNLRCDRATYERCIERESLDPDDYQDILKHLEGNDTMFFERVFLPAPKKKQLDAIVNDFRTTAVIIQNFKGIAPRHMSKFNCSGCEFKQICEAEVRGLDVNFVKKAHYQDREKFDGKKGKKKVSKKKAKSTRRKKRAKSG